MQNINDIVASIRRGERLSASDALVLWREAPLWLLGELATQRKREVSGRSVFYNRNVHLEPSNVCLFNCEFCSFRRRDGDPDAWTMSIDEVEARAKELRSADITEVHIVGGVHPSHNLDTYVEMVRRVKRQLPHVAVKAYTAVEIFYMISRAGVSIAEGLRRLAEAGMECIPGGGAEIFDAALRKKICPDKCSAEEWLEVHREAHKMGLSTNCTMLYGHIETLDERVDHLERLRKLQDEAPGFDAFIPLKYHSRNNRLSAAGECSVEDDLRTIAISRLFLDNIPHIKAYWVSYGKATTEMALAFGADDIDGTIGDTTKIYSMAGGTERPSMSVEELENMVRAAGMEPVERDSHYNVVTKKVVDKVERVENKMEHKSIETKKIATMAEERVVARSKAREPERAATKRATAPVRTTQSRKPAGEGRTKNAKSTVWAFLRRRPIIANILYIGIFCMALVVVLFFALKSGTRHNNTIVVPNFVGMTIGEARADAERRDLNIVVRDSIFDVDLPGGTIVDQLPGTSEVRDVTVKPGRKIYVTVNAFNRRQVDVPYVAKQTLRQALNQLERSGLTVDKLVYEPDMTSTDYVERQMVGGKEITSTSNRKVSVGTGVTLYVTYHRDNQQTFAPRVVGMSLAKAKANLWDYGLNVGKVVYDESVSDVIERRQARVYKQSVAIGSVHDRGTKVDIYLSANDNLVDSLRLVAEKEAERAETERRKLQQAKQREADSLAKLGVIN
ncbi:MAG: aminofutalosine synthase MqnE [Alistipes sp.]|nr:aminofutalosine synthase MqnE [Alistipes sp.]